MIRGFDIKNLGPLNNVKVDNLNNMNIILGENGKGKSFLMKYLYTLAKTKSDFQKGDDKSTINEIISKKFNWTFQCEDLGDLVTKGEKTLKTRLKIDKDIAEMSFSPSTTKQVKVKGIEEGSDRSVVYLPTKEVLEISNIILNTRLNYKSFGFDNTYYDLVTALQKPPIAEREGLSSNVSEFRGNIEFDANSNRWIYKLDNNRISMNNTAEGIKKLGILDLLIKNGTLKKGSILFIDEPESNLHPKAIAQFMEELFELSEQGIQIFISTHSYFVIKKLHILSKSRQKDMTLITLDEESITYNLRDAMPKNGIIQESINLFDEELEVDMG